MNWYSFTGKTKEIDGREFKQLQYEKAIGEKRPGDIIGWVESESSLKSPCEITNSTIYKESAVGDMCKIFSSTLSGDSFVYGKIILNESNIRNAHFICDRINIHQYSIIKETEVSADNTGKIIVQVDGSNTSFFKFIGSKINKSTDSEIKVSVCGDLRVINTTFCLKEDLVVEDNSKLIINESTVKDSTFLSVNGAKININKSNIINATLGNGDININESSVYSNIYSEEGYAILVRNSEMRDKSEIIVIDDEELDEEKKGVFKMSHCKLLDQSKVYISSKTRVYHYMNESTMKDYASVTFEHASYIVKTTVSNFANVTNSKVNNCVVSGQSMVTNICITNCVVSKNAFVGSGLFEERYKSNKSVSIFNKYFEGCYDCKFIFAPISMYASINGELFYVSKENLELIPIKEAFEDAKDRLRKMIIAKKNFNILKYDVFDVEKMSKKSMEIISKDLPLGNEGLSRYVRNMELLGVYNIFFSCARGCFADEFIPFLDNVFRACKFNIFDKNIEEMQYDKITFLSRFIPNDFLSDKTKEELNMFI